MLSAVLEDEDEEVLKHLVDLWVEENDNSFKIIFVRLLLAQSSASFFYSLSLTLCIRNCRSSPRMSLPGWTEIRCGKSLRVSLEAL